VVAVVAVIVGFPPIFLGEKGRQLYSLSRHFRGEETQWMDRLCQKGEVEEDFSLSFPCSCTNRKHWTAETRHFHHFCIVSQAFFGGVFFFQWHSSIAEFFRLLFLIPSSSFLYLCLVSGKRGQEKYYFECQDFLIDMQNKKTRSKEQREKEKKDTGLSYFNSLRLTIRFLIIRGGKTQRVVTKR
jgi:hypothetical protein